MSRPNPKLRRRKNVGMKALTKAAELKEKFQTITKEIEAAQKD